MAVLGIREPEVQTIIVICTIYATPCLSNNTISATSINIVICTISAEGLSTPIIIVICTISAEGL